MSEEGAGVVRNDAKAASLYLRACRDKDWAACANLARLYASGRGAPKDDARAVSLLMSSCGQGVAPACAHLTASQEAGIDLSTEVNSARSTCESRVAAGCRKLGVMYTRGAGVPLLEQHGVRLLRIACDQGDAEACGELANVITKPTATPPEAIALYDRACAKGHTSSCWTLAHLLDLDSAGAESKGRARELYGKARGASEAGCEKGDSAACLRLGFAYDLGLGVSTDLPRARGLFQKACDSPPHAGCTVLARKFRQGWGVEKDLGRAWGLVNHGCLKGQPAACFELAQMTERGEGTPRDPGLATSLYERACRSGDSAGCQELARRQR